MTLAVIALVLPALFSIGPHSLDEDAQEFTSIGVAIVLLILYGLYVYYTIFRRNPEGGRSRSTAAASHGSTTEGVSADSGEEEHWSKRKAYGLLVAATAGVVVMSEVLVGSVEHVVSSLGLTELFLGVVLIPNIGNAAENLVAVRAAAGNKMDLCVSIAVGSCLQIALFVAPVLVFASLLLGHRMTLLFNEYELAAVAAAIIVATFISMDGESNWLEGAQLLTVYVIIGLGFFFLS
jgi:Ca2+:H+ antiporter